MYLEVYGEYMLYIPNVKTRDKENKYLSLKQKTIQFTTIF